MCITILFRLNFWSKLGKRITRICDSCRMGVVLKKEKERKSSWLKCFVGICLLLFSVIMPKLLLHTFTHKTPVYQ